jgi:CTP synthase (UTP-ammonia lyase)
MSDDISTLRIALVGDQRPDVLAHTAIPKALEIAAESIASAVSETWFPTVALSKGAEAKLRGFHGIWCIPGSPYASMEGVLGAIRFARENKVPFLGTCGGCQHALIEYCRHVLGLADADHAESNPDARLPLIVPLPCALREVEARVRLEPGSRTSTIYGRNEITEPFNCGFGLNPEHQQLFGKTKLKITGTGEDNMVRVVELDDHPFFFATLFQPERSALKNVRHPLIAAFVRAAATARTTARHSQQSTHSL